MKKLVLIFLALVTMSGVTQGKEGEMGYFGGVSTGVKLPTFVELSQDKRKSASRYEEQYKELIYITGRPEEVSGTISIRPGEVNKEKGTGKYTESYLIRAQNEDASVKLIRNVSLSTEYVYNAQVNQSTKVSTVSSWTETLTVRGQTYVLDRGRSSFSKSMLEDYMPGVTYYRGDVQYEAVYRNVSNNNYVSIKVNSPVYGFDHAYAKSETQKRTIFIDNGDAQFYIEETPNYTAYKDIRYGKNEPDAISMRGNYKEFMRREGFLNYNIIKGSVDLLKKDTVGSIGLTTSPEVEQLVVPSLARIIGHPSESDIRRMFGVGAISGDVGTYAPNKQITRKEYVSMLVGALQIQVPAERELKKRENPFLDVKEVDPMYASLLAAADAGLISEGRVNGSSLVTLEQATTLNIRALGLSRFGSGGIQTPFLDDYQLSSWAKPSVYAAYHLGLIGEGVSYFNPKKIITHADAATLINRLLNYMRYDLQKDYNQTIVF